MKNKKYTIHLPLSKEEQFLVDEIFEAERMREQHQNMANELKNKIEILNVLRRKLNGRK